MMNGKGIMIAAAVIGVVGIVSGMVWSAEKGNSNEANANQDIAMTTSARITIEGPTKTALENIPGKVIETTLEKRLDKTVWKIEILSAEEAILAVYVDAVSGSVLTTEEKVAGKKPTRDTKS